MAKNIFIFVPAFGQQVSAATFMCTHQVIQHLSTKSVGGSVSTLSFPDIAELRSMAMTMWYDTMPQFDYLLFVDADMAFPPEIVPDMMLFDEPIVGAIYPQRKIPLSWAGSGTGGPTTERRGNFMKVEGVGMGCTLIRRDVVPRFIENHPELVDERIALHPAKAMLEQTGTKRIIRAFEKLDLKERGLVSEDLSFCIRWNNMGGACWAAIGYEMHHIGPYDYHGCYLQYVDQTIAAQEAQKQQEAVVGPQSQQLVSILPPEPAALKPEALPAFFERKLGAAE